MHYKHVKIILKRISDIILQHLNSVRQDGVKSEFAKIQGNLEEVCLKLLTETKRTESVNREIPFEQTLQPSAVGLLSKSDTSICIQEVQ